LGQKQGPNIDVSLKKVTLTCVREVMNSNVNKDILTILIDFRGYSQENLWIVP